jgi:hypothetical protein
VKKTWTGFERMHILDCFDKCMGEMIGYYSKNIKKFELFPSEEKAAHDQHIRSKIEKIYPQMFYQVFDNFNRLDTNKINFWKTDRTGNYCNRLIHIYFQKNYLFYTFFVKKLNLRIYSFFLK